MTTKPITSDEMLEKLKEIIDVPDHIIYLKMTLNTKNYAVIQIERFLTGEESVKRGIQPGTLIVDEKYVCIRPAELEELTKERDEALMAIENLSRKLDQYEDHGWDK